MGSMTSRVFEKSPKWITMWLAAILVLCEANTGLADPLRPHPTNPRYFTDGSGKAIYLTGSHTWDAFQRWFEGAKWKDELVAGSPASFTDYLDVIESHDHNYIRLWVADTAWSPLTQALVEPQPYVRTGPGSAADGGAKFNLEKLNPDYFNSLRDVVQQAGDRGIYVSVMLFDGWGASEYGLDKPGFNTWPYHPFNAANNINGVDGDPDGDGIAWEYHAATPGSRIWKLQTDYVEKVIDTVNDLDNVLYEINNESGAESTAWQYAMIKHVKAYESTKPKAHPVGMTFQYSGNDTTTNGDNQALFDSPADWISPGRSKPYFRNPTAADGGKVIITDTDHISSKTTDPTWVWRSFMRGLNPIVMDWWNGDEHWDPARNAMGHTSRLANSMDLAAMVPSNNLASTKYCLAEPGRQYLVYLQEGDSLTLNLEAGTYDTHWEDTNTGKKSDVTKVTSEGGAQPFRAPSSDTDWVLVVTSAVREPVFP